MVQTQILKWLAQSRKTLLCLCWKKTILHVRCHTQINNSSTTFVAEVPFFVFSGKGVLWLCHAIGVRALDSMCHGGTLNFVCATWCISCRSRQVFCCCWGKGANNRRGGLAFRVFLKLVCGIVQSMETCCACVCSRCTCLRLQRLCVRVDVDTAAAFSQEICCSAAVRAGAENGAYSWMAYAPLAGSSEDAPGGRAHNELASSSSDGIICVERGQAIWQGVREQTRTWLCLG